MPDPATLGTLGLTALGGLGGLFGGGGGGPSQTVYDLYPDWAWPFLDNRFPSGHNIPLQAGQIFENYPDFPSETIAPFTPNEVAGQNYLTDFAGGGLQNLYQQGVSGFQDLMNPRGGVAVAPGLRENLSSMAATGGVGMPGFESLVRGELSPFYQDVLRGGINDVARSYGDLTTDIFDRAQRDLFASDDSALLTGNFGGSAQGTGRQNVAQEFAKAQGRADIGLQENLAQLYGDVMNRQFSDARTAQLGAFGDILGARSSALGDMVDLDTTMADINARMGNLDRTVASNVLNQLPQLANLGLLPGQVMTGVGGAERELEQSVLNDQVQQWMRNPFYPLQQLTSIMSPLITGAPGAVNLQGGGSDFGNFVGGGLMGLGLAGQLGFNPFGNRNDDDSGGYVNPNMLGNSYF